MSTQRNRPGNGHPPPRPANAAPARSTAKPPAGFSVEGRDSLDGWVDRRPNNVVHGELVGEFTMDGKFGPRRIYKVKLAGTPCHAKLAGGQSVTLTKGIVGLDETGYLKKLRAMPLGRVVYLVCVGQDNTKNRAWVWEIHSDRNTGTGGPIVPLGSETPDADGAPAGEDEIPF